MGDFDKFLSINKIKKQEIAKFLGVSKSFVTQLCNGQRKIPADKLALIKANPVWDSSALEISVNTGIQINAREVSGNVSQDNRQYFSDSPDVLRAQIDQLEQLIREKEARIAEKDKQIAEKDKQIAGLITALNK